MRCVVNNALPGDAGFRVIADGRAAVEVTIKAREVATADLQADGMPGAKEVRRHPAVDDEFLDLPGLQELGWATALAVAAADDAVTEIPGPPVREDVDQLGGEIGVRAIGAGEEMDDDRTRDFQIMIQRL